MPDSATAALFSAAKLAITDPEYLETATLAYLGKKIFVRLEDLHAIVCYPMAYKQ